MLIGMQRSILMCVLGCMVVFGTSVNTSSLRSILGLLSRKTKHLSDGRTRVDLLSGVEAIKATKPILHEFKVFLKRRVPEKKRFNLSNGKSGYYNEKRKKNDLQTLQKKVNEAIRNTFYKINHTKYPTFLTNASVRLSWPIDHSEPINVKIKMKLRKRQIQLQLQLQEWLERQQSSKRLHDKVVAISNHSTAAIRKKRFFANSFVSKYFRKWFSNSKKAHKFKSISKLKHFAISVSKYDVFVSRYGIYVFIPSMMFYTLLYILFLKWRFLDTDPLGVEATAYLFEKAGRKVLESTNEGLRRDPRTGKMFFLPGYEKDEEVGVQDVMREVMIVADIVMDK